MKRYLIEYNINYNNGKPIGKDDLFSGEGVFYIKAESEKKAKAIALKKIKVRFKRLEISFERIEEARG